MQQISDRGLTYSALSFNICWPIKGLNPLRVTMSTFNLSKSFSNISQAKKEIGISLFIILKVDQYIHITTFRIALTNSRAKKPQLLLHRNSATKAALLSEEEI